MAARSLKTRILASFLLVIVVMSLSIALLGYYVIQKDIIDRTEQAIMTNLKAGRSFYSAEIDRIGQAFGLVPFDGDIDSFKKKINLDYAILVERNRIREVKSEIVRAAFDRGQPVGGTRIIENDELTLIDPFLSDSKRITIKATQRSTPTQRKYLDSVMAKEYAVPQFDSDRNITGVLYGGRVINFDYALVDKIRNLVFGNRVYNDKPIGTVTIFQDDTRIATNVLDENGQRAVGTRVSAEVYEKVVQEGKVWHDRAFVVTDWYKTAYEPIKNIDGKIIGILYVGVLEEPFKDMARNILFMFLVIVIGAAVLAVLLSVILASAVSKPLVNVLDATYRLSDGNLDHRIKTETGVAELDKLSQSFNSMTRVLDEREQSLRISNEKLAAANKSYIDLIGFVAHELKGILASAVMNAYAVRDGYLGLINFKQRRAIDSVTRNLDYLTATVTKFLNLGRIEKGEMKVNKADINLKKDVFNVSIESLLPLADRKNITVNNKIAPDLQLNADKDLLQIVANNLVVNAIKYGNEKGVINITAAELDGIVEVDVYNDSTPITDVQKEKLFRRFSRLDTEATKKNKGTGLGLYITSKIIAGHGGSIRVQPREHGNSFIFQIERS